jgi:hypothetical protein
MTNTNTTTRPDGQSSVSSSFHSIQNKTIGGRNHNNSFSNFSSTGLGTDQYPSGQPFEQQTFLGASIRSVNINAGYGDSVTTLSVELINDPYNSGDVTGVGLGDDVYHSGTIAGDRFTPPAVGSPVFFKLGRRRAPVNEAYKNVYDSIYGTTTAINSIGRNHLCFGGILQSYVQNRGPGGNPLYSVQVVDPREILSNVEIILNNYAGSTYNKKNIFNVYGFLEYNLPESVETSLGTKYILQKIINSDGSYYFVNDDTYGSPIAGFFPYSFSDSPTFFPITGTGFSRRGPQGMPFFKLQYGFNALLGIYGKLPQPYIDNGFGSFINFRGFNYMVDFGGLPNLPPYYFIDYDQINLLDLCLEICEVTNRELFVSLLPIIEHPACGKILDWNKSNISNFVAGIIRIDTIDRSFQPSYGSIKRYIDKLTSAGVPVENQDVGFELTNIVTDKLVVGAQEVDMYCFSHNNDRHGSSFRSSLAGQSSPNESDQWRLANSLKQQILPYYGLLGNNAVTIPKGYGAYQQILLDSSSLNANGVGLYYVTTEMELRAALISYERWSQFLLSYNDVYMEDTTGNGDFEVTVPRCVFDSDSTRFGLDGLPASPCSPPFGYPLYYKRATKIGVYGAGLSELYGKLNGISTSIAQLQGATNKSESAAILSNIWDDLSSRSLGDLSETERSLLTKIENLKNNADKVTKEVVVGLVQEFEVGLGAGYKILNRLSKKTKENSLKVYNFVRSIADECLGKKFLVKIPRNVNTQYSNSIVSDTNFNYSKGPFGFKPRTPGFSSSGPAIPLPEGHSEHIFELFLNSSNANASNLIGALRANFNPITDKYEYNYEPEPQGGYFGFDLAQTLNGQIRAVNFGLIPQDFTKFILNNSRISPYVRFDHSETLSFNGISSDSFVQQKIAGNYFIPDLANQLENTGEDKVFDLPEQSDTLVPTVAFVKCELDSKFYMPPKFFKDIGSNGAYQVNVHGEQYETLEKLDPINKKLVCVSGIDPKTGDIFSSGLWIESPRTSKSLFYPKPASGSKKASDLFFVRNKDTLLIETKDLDTNNVYALITLPGRIVATQYSRYRDSIIEQVNPAMYKHFLTMDVVRIPEFNNPPTVKGTPTFVTSTKSLQAAYNIGIEKTVNYSLHNRLSFASPSPIYPDLVVLPLMSKDRCYGPWPSGIVSATSAKNDPFASGGKIEFIKDENLSPWNFSGYDLMNDAGNLRASFTGPLLTQSERGGIVIPDVPSGIFIGKFLQNAGPLVTNISMDVSENGIKSTVKMDLYTVSFGKLQKQKENIISNVSRERQKIRDENNALIRMGLAKNQSNVSYQLIYNNIKNSINSSNLNYNSINGPSITHTVASVDIDSEFLGSNNKFNQSASVQSLDQLNETADLMPNSISAYSKYYNSAASSLSEQNLPFSREPHNNMPWTPGNLDYTKELYKRTPLS